MTTDNEPRVVVTQEDRLLVADILDEVSNLLDHVGIGQVADLIRDGEFDEHECVVIARDHRIATEEACRAREAEALRHLDAVLDMADEAYRKYCGEEFDGFDAEDVAVLQAARNYWLEAAFPRAKDTTDATGEGK